MSAKIQAGQAGDSQSEAFEISGESFAKKAETIMKDRETTFRGLTMTQLRKIYMQIANLYTRITDETSLNEKGKGELQYLKVKMAYAAGRDRNLKLFLNKTKLMELVDSIDTYDEFILFCRYAESLVAYFKYYGGKG